MAAAERGRDLVASAARPLALAIPTAFYVVFIARTSFGFEGRTFYTLFDDAMISMRYGRNLADGHGLVWNAGERVEGYSNFLWTVLMAGAHLLGLPDSRTSVVVMAAGVLLLLGTVVVVGRICHALAPDARSVSVVAMALTAFFYPLVFWTLRGMEVGLAAFLVAAAVLLAIRLAEAWAGPGRWWLAATLAAAVLTRDDLLIPAVLVVAYVVWRAPAQARRQAGALLGGVVVGTIALHTIYRLAYYGSALPNTYYLKIEGISLWTRLRRGATALAYTSLTELYAPLLLAGAYFVSARRSALRGTFLVAAIFVAQCAYTIYVGGDAWEDAKYADRYIATVAPMLFVLAALGIEQLLSPAMARRRVAAALTGALLLAGLLQLKDWLPTQYIGFPKSTDLQLLRPALAVVCAGAVGLTIFVWRRRSPAGRTGAMAAVLGLAMLVAANALPVRDWARFNSVDRPDEDWARTGLLVRELTPPNTSVAMTAAGNTAYFARRPAIDLLGKMDPVVAHGPPKWIEFRPGHNKWDYAHSIGVRRPDLITQLWFPTTSDLCELRAWGYRNLAPQLYVRDGAAGPKVAELARRVSALHFLPPIAEPSSVSCSAEMAGGRGARR